MFFNYLKIAYRNLSKYKAYSFINISGLAVGMVCCILMLLYIQHELSYDRFHENSDKIYRIIEKYELGDAVEILPITPFPVATTLPVDYPQYVKSATRMFNFFAPSLSLKYGENSFNEKHLFFADSTFFRIFSFDLVIGNPDEVLRNPNSIVINETTAGKYFGNDNPIGKVMQYEGQIDLMVTGVVKDVPSNSHIKFDGLISLNTLEQVYPDGVPTSWYWNPCITYVLLDENTSAKVLEAELPEFVDKYFPESFKEGAELTLQPLLNVHLYSDFTFDPFVTSDIDLIYILSLVAFLVLVIASFNFVNLSTARAAKRAREVGMRKVLGALKRQLIYQFIGESILVSVLAVMLSLVAVDFIIPYFNSFAQVKLSMDLINNGVLLLGIGILVISVGFIAGVYPAFFLSSFKPVKVLKGNILNKRSKIDLRQLLVIGQFTVATIMIVSTVIAFEQLRFMRDRDLGFNQDEILLLPIYRTEMVQKYEGFKDRMLQNANVKSVTVIENIIGTGTNSGTFWVEGFPKADSYSRISVRTDFIETFDLELLAGRKYTKEFISDGKSGLLINESMLKVMEIDNPEEAIGIRVMYGPNSDGGRRITGVVKDFNFASLHEEVRPFFIVPIEENNFFNRFVAIKINMNDVKNTLAFIEENWNSTVNGKPFEFSFMNEELNKQYKSEEQFGSVVGVFSTLAIVVACLGLLGLVSFSSEQRTKEIGIRKVLGASVNSIVNLVSFEFIKLVLISNLIAWPVAYYLMTKWLQDFAYRTDIGISIFVLSLGVTLTITLGTVAYHAIKSAMSNPINSIKYE